MEFLGDFHLHSRFSRATSRELSLPNLHAWAQRKGLALLGTGDLTHPEWFAELRDMLVPAGEGVYRLRDDLAAAADAGVPTAARGPVRFLLTGEISGIYKQGGKTRKVHTVVFAPSFATAARINAALTRVGNIRSDGRPILGLSARDLLEIVLEAGDDAFVVPAHIWTPWFSLLGSRSGFDSLEECYGDLAPHVFAAETGLSADPAMCRRVSGLDRLALVSNSDAHSGPKLGREANVFDTEPDFPSIRAAWTSRDSRRFKGTIEFFPEEGKYHLDGHRKCGVRWNPSTSREHGGRCPACGKPLTLGVLSRVEALADREAEHPAVRRDRYEMLVPLTEVLGEVLAVNPGARKVLATYESLLSRLGPELEILRRVPPADIERHSSGLVAEAIRRMRAGDLHIEAGYDGEFGKVRIFAPGERSRLAGQGTLFAPAPAGLFEAADRVAPERPPPRVESVPGAREIAPAPAEPARGDARGDRAQREAIEAPPGPLLVLAGPGTGKTRTLTHRIARRVREGEFPADRVLAVTFTNRAAEEMRERLAALLPGPAAPGAPTVCTFHALGLELLRPEAAAVGFAPDFRVLDEAERDRLIRRALGGRASGTSLARAKRTLDAEGSRPPGAAGESDLRRRYEQVKRAENAVDFDDLVRLPAELGRRPERAARWRERFRFVCVDEYQDLNPAQYALLRCLVPADGDLTVIGDPDQAIYAFRGADSSFFRAFETHFPGARVVRLSRCYRSTETILAAATQVIARAPAREPSRLWSGLTGPERITIRAAPTPAAEAEGVVEQIERLLGGTSEFSVDSGRVEAADAGRGFGFADIAVLYRLNAIRPALEAALDRAGLPYQTADHEPVLDDPAVREAVAGLRAEAPGDAGSVADRLASRIADARLRVPLCELARPFGDDAKAFLDALALGRGVDLHDPRADRISLLTLHASKGLEFPVVFIAGLEEGILPFPGPPVDPDGSAPDIAPDALEEERRLLYVGMTRARTRLHLTRAGTRVLFGRRTSGRPSRFLAEIEDALKEVFDTPASARRRGPEQRSLF